MIYYKSGSVPVDGWQNVTIAVSLEKFDVISLILRYLGNHLIEINMSTHVMKYFYVEITMVFTRRRHVDIITCR